MAKRFTDTEKWQRPWFRKLSPKYRFLWLYILDHCDIAGIWYVDIETASYFIGEMFDQKEAEGIFKKQIEVKQDRWLLKDFVFFQYGNLNERNKLFWNIQKKLSEFHDGAFMPHISPINGVKDKDKSKDKDKDGFKSATDLPKKIHVDTDIQKVVKGWKILNGIPTEGPESVDWDKVHFPRHAKSAQSLLTLFRNLDEALNCMEFVFDHLTKKKLSCTIETIVKHSDIYREKLQVSTR